MEDSLFTITNKEITSNLIRGDTLNEKLQNVMTLNIPPMLRSDIIELIEKDIEPKLSSVMDFVIANNDERKHMLLTKYIYNIQDLRIIFKYYPEYINSIGSINRNVSSTLLIEASRFKLNDLFNLIINRLSNTIKTYTDISGSNALHYASLWGSDYILEELLEDGVIDKNVRNNKGRTPLMIACLMNNKNIVKLLILYGANTFIQDVNGKTAYDYNGELMLQVMNEIRMNEIRMNLDVVDGI